MRPRTVLLCTVLAAGACAARRPARAPSATRPAATPEAERPAVEDPDADADGIGNAADPCPLEPGPAGGTGCPAAYGSLFLRVLDAETRAPVAATLAFSPNVNRVYGEDDGYAGTLAPGDYVVTAEAPGYSRAVARFTVTAEARQTVVLTLRPLAVSTP